MLQMSTRSALVFSLGLSLPISVAILVVNLDNDSGRSQGPLAASAPTTVRVEASPTMSSPAATQSPSNAAPVPTRTPTEVPSPSPSAPSQLPRKVPQGAVEIAAWSNSIEFSAACAKLNVTIANRSDTSVNRVTLLSKGEDSKEREIVLPPTTFSAGVQAFGERDFVLKICDDRMAENQFGPAAIPTRITWTWME